MKYLLLLPLLFALALPGCKKDSTSCENLRQGLIDLDNEKVIHELDPWTSDLQPEPTASDPTGHAANFERLIERLNSNCSAMTATKGCYNCIQTLPAQSEIRIELDSAGITLTRTIDILTPDDGPLKAVNVHH